MQHLAHSCVAQLLHTLRGEGLHAPLKVCDEDIGVFDVLLGLR